MLHATALKLTCSSGDHISNPFAFSTIGERNQKSFRRSKKKIHWRPVDPT
ncbi:MAG: hypothetical protein JWO91_192 [Acidobacteriaceae bacterium]|nr:hypothetical protein [Acidobacteriaceae bacterium]